MTDPIEGETMKTTCPPPNVDLPRVSPARRARFWRKELPVRLRSWWLRHWWPARIRQLDTEREAWRRWCKEAEDHTWPSTEFIAGVISTFPPHDQQHPVDAMPIATGVMDALQGRDGWAERVDA